VVGNSLAHGAQVVPTDLRIFLEALASILEPRGKVVACTGHFAAVVLLVHAFAVFAVEPSFHQRVAEHFVALVGVPSAAA